MSIIGANLSYPAMTAASAGVVPHKVVLRPREAAKYIGLAPATLAKRRMRGDRPHFVRLGLKSVGYEITELDAFVAGGRRSSTSDIADAGSNLCAPNKLGAQKP